MLIVATRVKASAIEGVGLFAARPIARGTPIWEYRPPFDLCVEPAGLDGLPAQIRRLLSSHGYLYNRDGKWYLNLDDARFMNHSAEPNCEPTEEFMVAARDIAADEEITCDYFTYYTPNPQQPWLAALRSKRDVKPRA